VKDVYATSAVRGGGKRGLRSRGRAVPYPLVLRCVYGRGVILSPKSRLYSTFWMGLHRRKTFTNSYFPVVVLFAQGHVAREWQGQM
jgi:hypothetical protein